VVGHRGGAGGLGLRGLLPAAVVPLEQQVQRSYEQHEAQPDDLARNGFLAALRDRSQVLYYRLLAEHLTDLLPVVYDPVIALAIERFSHVCQRPDGVYLSVDDVDGVEEALRNFPCRRRRPRPADDPGRHRPWAGRSPSRS
jgi:malate dehydrogenase (oxaloacetate-decarboxylating)